MLVGPFTFSYCKECDIHAIRSRGEINIEHESKVGVQITTCEGAPSVKRADLIAAVERVEKKSLPNASAQFTFDTVSKKVAVIGPISNYEHDCHHGDPWAHAIAKALQQSQQSKPEPVAQQPNSEPPEKTEEEQPCSIM